MTRAGRSLASTTGSTNLVTTIGRTGEVSAPVTQQNAFQDATGRGREIGTAIVTKDAPGARVPPRTVREIEVALAGEEGGTHGRLTTESRTDDAEDVRALLKLTVVTRRDGK
jgi:hypothetical protein